MKLSEMAKNAGKKTIPPGPPKSLNPPKTIPEPIKEEDINDDFFKELATTSEFKRFMYRAIYGKVHRGTKAQLDRDLQKRYREIETAKEVASLSRGNKADFREVVKELKIALAKRKKIIE